MAYDMSEIDGEHFTEPYMVVDIEDIQKLSPIEKEVTDDRTKNMGCFEGKVSGCTGSGHENSDT